eukprot:GHVU01190709.1.p2 GENE.GHVU01190709.1~~GHVU01190709.1.p2  ORF type:complete len:194 (+),score=21.01 GHVU01190709.1:552-1133(+)
MKFRYWTRAELIRGDFFLSIYICIYLIILFFLLLLFLFFFFLFFLLFLFFFSLIFFCIITGLVPAAASSKSSVSSSSAVLGKVLRAGGDTLLVGLGDNRYCERIRRPHKSNGVYLAVDTASRTFDQRCHDPDCRGFRSERRHLPHDSAQYEEPVLAGADPPPRRDESTEDELTRGLEEMEIPSPIGTCKPGRR